MPLKVNVGLSKKLGLPDYGSVGASCHVEFDAETMLPEDDLDAFHRLVRNAYVACAQAVNDELSRHRRGQDSGNSQPHAAGRFHASSAGAANHNGQADSSNPANGRRATEKQLAYLRQLASQIRGLGIRRLETLAQRMFDKPVAELTSLDASGLIDTLKAIKAGEINLESALNGAAP